MTTIATMMTAVPPILGLVVVPAFYVVSDRVRSKVLRKDARDSSRLLISNH